MPGSQAYDDQTAKYMQVLLPFLDEGEKTVFELSQILHCPVERVIEIVRRVNAQALMIDADSNMRNFVLTAVGRDYWLRASQRLRDQL